MSQQPTIASSNLAWDARLAHLRALAALLVFVFHVFHSFYGQWLPQPGPSGFGWIAEGHTGVSLFFVLSGYLFMSIALAHPGPIHYGRFMRNRLLRIFPLFLFVFFVAISIGRDDFRAADVFYVFFSNLGQAPTSNQFITGAAWTISVEFTFYLVFPFLARFARAEGPAWLLRLIALVLLFKLGGFLVSERPTHMIYSTLLGRFDQFLLGMLAALLAAGPLRARLRVGLPLLWPLALGGLLALAIELQSMHASYFLPQPAQLFWVFWPTLEASLWAAFIVAWQAWRGAPPTLVDRLLQRIGEHSYSLYLWHGLIIYFALRLIGPAPGWTPWWQLDALVLCMGLLLPCLHVAALSYRTIEAPFLGLRGCYTQRSSPKQSERAPET